MAVAAIRALTGGGSSQVTGSSTAPLNPGDPGYVSDWTKPQPAPAPVTAPAPSGPIPGTYDPRAGHEGFTPDVASGPIAPPTGGGKLPSYNYENYIVTQTETQKAQAQMAATSGPFITGQGSANLKYAEPSAFVKTASKPWESTATSSYVPYMGGPGGLVINTSTLPLFGTDISYKEIGTHAVEARKAEEMQRAPTTPMAEFLKSGYQPPLTMGQTGGTTLITAPARPSWMGPKEEYEMTREERIATFLPKAVAMLGEAGPVERLQVTAQTLVTPQWAEIFHLPEIKDGYIMSASPAREKALTYTMATNLYRESLQAQAPGLREQWLMTPSEYSERMAPITAEKQIIVSQGLFESGPGQVVTAYGGGVMLSPLIGAASPLLAKSTLLAKAGSFALAHPLATRALVYSPIAGIETVKGGMMLLEGKQAGPVIAELGKDILVMKAFTTGITEMLPKAAVAKPLGYKVTGAKGIMKTEIEGVKPEWEVMGRETWTSKYPVKIPKAYKGMTLSVRHAVGEQGMAREFAVTSEGVVIPAQALKTKTTISSFMKEQIQKIRDLSNVRYTGGGHVAEMTRGNLEESLRSTKPFSQTTYVSGGPHGFTLRSNVEAYFPTEAIETTWLRIPAKAKLGPMKPFEVMKEVATSGKQATAFMPSAPMTAAARAEQTLLYEEQGKAFMESLKLQSVRLHTVPIFEAPVYAPSVLMPFAMPSMGRPVPAGRQLTAQSQQLKSETNQIITPLKEMKFSMKPIEEQKIVGGGDVVIGPQIQISEQIQTEIQQQETRQEVQLGQQFGTVQISAQTFGQQEMVQFPYLQAFNLDMLQQRKKKPFGEEPLQRAKKVGELAWKQGAFFKTWRFPFGQKDVTTTRKPLKGVPYEKGFGSASRSAVKRGEWIPEEVSRKMGVVSMTAYTPDGKPELTFKGIKRGRLF